MAGQHGLKKVNKNHHYTHGFGNTRRQDLIGDRLAINVILKIESRLQKEKKNKTQTPPMACSANSRKERKRKKYSKSKKARIQSKTFLSFSLKTSRPNTSLLNQKLKTHSNKKKGKEKWSNKQEKRRRKEEGGASKQVYLQELHQNQVYHVHNAISKVGVSNQDHKSYLR